MIWIILFLRRRLSERAIGKKQAWLGKRQALCPVISSLREPTASLRSWYGNALQQFFDADRLLRIGDRLVISPGASRR